MKFPYTAYEVGKGRVIYRPTLPITLECNGFRIPVADALVDTGADETLLPLDFAIAFGFRFDLKKEGEEWSGAGGGTFKVFAAPKPIQFLLEQDGFPPIRWNGPARFTLSQPTILLGHKGCLQHLDVLFRGKQKILDVRMA